MVRALRAVVELSRRAFLALADAFFLGEPARVLGWWCVDTWRNVRTGQRERLYGLWLIVGLYGRGKTAWLVDELERQRRQRGDRVLIFTNFGWAGEDGPLTGWRQMVEALETETPHIFAWDELGSSLDQHQWGKEFPRELFSFVTQMRKGPGVRVYATVQRFSNASVDLRRLAEFIVEVRSFFRARWVWSYAYAGYEEYNDGLPRYSPMGTRDMRKVAWSRRFVFSDFLRGRYDSFRIIPALKEFSDEQMAKLAEGEAGQREEYRVVQGRRGAVGGPVALAPAPTRRGFNRG